MNITAKTDYSCRSLVQLALHWPASDPVQIQVIADKQSIPIKFLTQILVNLKQLGYVQSVRGKKGGYLLSRSPKDINLFNVLNDLSSINSTNLDHMLKEKKENVMTKVWRELDEAIIKKLKDTNFEDIINAKKAQDSVLMFEI